MKLAAQKRDDRNAQSLRAQDRIPGVIYNHEINLPVSLELRAFDKAFRSQGTSNIITLDIAGEEHDVLVKAVQMDKRRRGPIHVDFYKIIAGEPVEVHVPIEFVGDAVGAKAGGQVDIQRRDVAIRILPRLIPHKIEVNISELNINDAVHVGQIFDKFPPEAEFLVDAEEALVVVLPPRLEEPEEPTEEAGVEPQLVGEEGEGSEGESSEGDDN